jgi:hypothetical protein
MAFLATTGTARRCARWTCSTSDMERPAGSFFFTSLGVACSLCMDEGRPLFYFTLLLLSFFLCGKFPLPHFHPPLSSLFIIVTSISEYFLCSCTLWISFYFLSFSFFFFADGHGARMDQKGGYFHPACNIELSIEDGCGRRVCVSCMSGPSIEFVSRLHYDIAHADLVGWILELCIG